ncbi:MAG: TolC family protein, partial [Gammaproteobacteria bacterium]|nr:TolC family protein [Gammaproteobacteria bacterium]
GEFDRAKQAAASEIFSLAADVEAGWYELAGAEQIATMRRAVVKATTAAAELAERFFEAGNITHLELALERAAASEARLESLEARAAVIQQRTRLNRLLGLSGGASYEIVSGLPEPPAEEEGLDTLMELSLASRLDLAAQRREVELLADNLGVTRRYRWLGAVGDVEIGAERERETDGSTLRGPTLALELPVFNQNADSITRAEAELAIAAAELDALQIEVSNAVRLAYAEVETARARLREHAEALVPLREEIVARTQEQVNFMLLGVFELLRVQREEYDAYQSYLEAARDYWLARVELERAVGTALPGAGAPVTAIDAGKLTGPAPMDMEGMQHSEPDAPTDKSGQMQHGERETPAEESGQMQHHKHDDGDTGTEENESPDHSEHGDQP